MGHMDWPKVVRLVPGMKGLQTLQKSFVEAYLPCTMIVTEDLKNIQAVELLPKQSLTERNQIIADLTKDTSREMVK